MCHNGYNHHSWVSSSFSCTAYSCWILFNATALSTEVHGLWYCWWALNLLRWAAFYGFLGMLKSNKWQTGGAIRKAHMFLINQQIDACLEGSLTPARVACQELPISISISIRQFCKISISIKYRIDLNLAYRTGLELSGHELSPGGTQNIPYLFKNLIWS